MRITASYMLHMMMKKIRVRFLFYLFFSLSLGYVLDCFLCLTALIIEMFQHFLKSLRNKLVKLFSATNWSLIWEYISLCCYSFLFSTCSVIELHNLLTVCCLCLSDDESIIFFSFRDDHPIQVSLDIENIMSLVLQESDDIPPEFLSPILHYIRKDAEVMIIHVLNISIFGNHCYLCNSLSTCPQVPRMLQLW